MKKTIKFFILATVTGIFLILSPLASQAQNQTELWGMTSNGGNGGGLLFKKDSNGNNQEVIKAFLEYPGANPRSELSRVANEKLYGIANGTSPDNNTVTTANTQGSDSTAAPHLTINNNNKDKDAAALNYYKKAVASVVCPANVTIYENEPDCYAEYVDATNGGCNSTPNVFTELTGCHDVVCGKAGTYTVAGSDLRDTDFYRLALNGNTTVNMKVVADFPLTIIVADETAGCAGLTIITSTSANAGDTAYINITFGPGSLIYWVGPTVFTGIPCGSNYVMYCNTVAISAPSSPVVANIPACITTELNAMAPPAGETYYWQGTSCGTSIASPATTPYPVNSSGTYYVSSKNDALGCWSPCSSVDISINYSNDFTDVVTACDSYTWINGTTYTSDNNTATDTLTNAAGCDSIVTLNLTINHSSASTDVVTACDSYTWINGTTYTASNNTATHTLTNAAGCDSIVTLNLTINYSNGFTDVVTACGSYTWINGTTYTVSNNTATHTLTNAAGCDSVVTLNLTINQSNAFTDVVTACDSYTWINGTTYTANNNTATHTLTTTAGCDSVVSLNLSINTVDVSATANGITMTAGASGATYQWTDCNNYYAPIINATNQIYTADSNGDYAVIVTEGACSDTSICMPINTIGINDLLPEIQLNISPNPNNGKFSIELNSSARIEIMDALGKLIYTGQHKQGKAEINLGNIASGVYLVKATSTNQIRTYRMLIEK